MRSHTELTTKLMIRKQGETVQHKKRITTDIGNGEVEYEYVVQEPKRGQFLRISPFDNTVNQWGQRIEADCIGTFLPGTDVGNNDLLGLTDAWYEITDTITHRTGGHDDYIEVLMRRRET